MKQWKKVVAIVLAAVMSLAILTGCSGGGGSSVGGTSYPAVKPDTYNEKKLSGYIKDYVSERCGIALTDADSKTREEIYSVLPQAVVCMENGLNGNYNANEYERAMDALNKKMTALGKHGYGTILPLGAMYSKSDIYAGFDGNSSNYNLSSYIQNLTDRGYPPKHVCVAATTKFNGTQGMDVVYVIITIMD